MVRRKFEIWSLTILVWNLAPNEAFKLCVCVCGCVCVCVYCIVCIYESLWISLFGRALTEFLLKLDGG